MTPNALCALVVLAYALCLHFTGQPPGWINTGVFIVGLMAVDIWRLIRRFK